MKTIEIYQRGYDFACEEDFILVPYTATKSQIIGYCKANFGVDVFTKYKFVIVRRSR